LKVYVPTKGMKCEACHTFRAGIPTGLTLFTEGWKCTFIITLAVTGGETGSFFVTSVTRG
jgi:hypothetical protein